MTPPTILFQFARVMPAIGGYPWIVTSGGIWHKLAHNNALAFTHSLYTQIKY